MSIERVYNRYSIAIHRRRGSCSSKEHMWMSFRFVGSTDSHDIMYARHAGTTFHRQWAAAEADAWPGSHSVGLIWTLFLSSAPRRQVHPGGPAVCDGAGRDRAQRVGQARGRHRRVHRRRQRPAGRLRRRADDGPARGRGCRRRGGSGSCRGAAPGCVLFHPTSLDHRFRPQNRTG